MRDENPYMTVGGHTHKDKVYVCIGESVNNGKQLAFVTRSKERAWEWVRNSFVEFQNHHDFSKEDLAGFDWVNTGREHSCACNYETIGWYVYEMDVED